MAAINPTDGEILGVAASDVLELYRGNKQEVKRVTVEELLRGTGIAACAPAWDDLRFPAQSINPPGTLTGPTIDDGETAFPGTLLFSGSADNIICGVGQLPHSWDRSALRPHIHWSKPTGSAAAVSWELRVRVIGNPGDVSGAWSDAIVAVDVAGDQSVSDNHVLSTFGDVTLTDCYESAMFAWRVYRRGGSDAETNAVRLFEFDVHYRIS